MGCHSWPTIDIFGLGRGIVAKNGRPDLWRRHSSLGRIVLRVYKRSACIGLARVRAAIAQLVEHLIRNERVGSSNLSCGTKNWSDTVQIIHNSLKLCMKPDLLS